MTNFNQYRLQHLRERDRSKNFAEIEWLINRLHHPCWTSEARSPRQYRLRAHYQDLPKYRGGYGEQSKLIAKNNLFEQLQKEQAAGEILAFFDGPDFELLGAK